MRLDVRRVICSTRKISFFSEAAAKKTLRPKIDKSRVYKCNICQNWHLTTKVKRK